MNEFTQATPRFLQIGVLLDDRLRIKQPLRVEVKKENDTFIAKCEYAEEFGYGISPMDAIADLQQTLSELYWSLKENKGLGRNLKVTKDRLDKVFKEV